MPCYLTGSFAGDMRLAADEAREQATLMTQIACEVMRKLIERTPNENILYELSPEAREWWVSHEMLDQMREADERNDRAVQKEFERIAGNIPPAELELLIQGIQENRHEELD